MENYRNINRELAINNGDLRSTITELHREVIYLNETIVELQRENACIKNSVKKILTNCYSKILKDVCGVSDTDLTKKNRSNHTVSPNSLSPVSIYNINVTSRRGKQERARKKSEETSIVKHFPLQNITNSNPSRTRSKGSLNISGNDDSSTSFSKSTKRTEIDDIDISEPEIEDSRQLKTIIEESDIVSTFESVMLRSENNYTLTQLNISTKEKYNSSYFNLYPESTNEMNTLTSHKTFGDTTMNLISSAPSSTPFKKRKHILGDNKFNKISVVKMRRLTREEILGQHIIKVNGTDNSVKVRRTNNSIKVFEENINIKSDKNGKPIKKKLKTKENFLSDDENQNADNSSSRPKRRAAPINFKEPSINTKMRYDPKQKSYHGSDITARTNGGITALSFIVRRTPDIIPKFIAKLDSSIKVNDHEIGDVDCEIKLDFRQLVPNTERGESELIMSFIEVGQKRILTHPLCETFLFLKWRRIRKFFLMSLFYHSVYVLLFSLYVTGVYVKSCLDDDSCRPSDYSSPVGYFVVVLNLALTGREFFEMGHGIYAYAKYWENWLQWTIILGVFLCVTPDTIISRDLEKVPKWQFHVAAIIIFLVWLELMMLVGRFPIFGLYIQMFTKVAVNFGKFLLAYCCLLIAFALSFSVLFSRYKAFKSIPWSFLKVVTMMAGELEFEDIFYGEEDVKSGEPSADSDTEIISFPVTSHIIFLAFVLLVTVILTNLVVGLAVSDIQGLQVSAGLDRLIRQAELVSRLESLFFSRLLRKTPPKILSLCQRSALLRTSRYQLQFMTRPNDPRDTQLPEDIKLNIFKLVADRRDRNQTIRRRRCEDNFDTFQRSVGRYDYSMGINNTKEDTCVLRPRSIAFSRQRLFSDNEKGMNKVKLTGKNSLFDSTESGELKDIKTQLRDMKSKFDKFTDILSKKINITTEELCRIKMQLDKQPQF